MCNCDLVSLAHSRRKKEILFSKVVYLTPGDYSNRRIFKPSKKSKLFKASKEFHSSEYFQVIS